LDQSRRVSVAAGLIAIGRDGHIAGRTISPGFAGLAHADHIQAEAIYDYAEALCQAAGTTMAKLLRAQYFVSDVAVFPGVAMAWSTRFGRQPHPFVCVQSEAAGAALRICGHPADR
jgi:enamine deaminase RidA (YjgF/YER057c/UK114 family)